jgi:hypothetical protein
MPVAPESVRNNARRGLALREEWGRGGTAVGAGRAHDLADGADLSTETIGRMVNFLSRHEDNYRPDKKESDGGPTAGTIAYLLWGGKSGKTWAESVHDRENKQACAAEHDSGKSEDMNKFETGAEVCKVDEALGLVFGYAIVSKVDGEPYYDLHGDHIPEDAMLEAATDFMLNSRVAKEMHEGEKAGEVVFAFPMTEDISKSLDIDPKRTGLLIAMKPSDPTTLEKFASGEYTGFSIGGQYIENEEVEDAQAEHHASLLDP